MKKKRIIEIKEIKYESKLTWPQFGLVKAYIRKQLAQRLRDAVFMVVHDSICALFESLAKDVPKSLFPTIFLLYLEDLLQLRSRLTFVDFC